MAETLLFKSVQKSPDGYVINGTIKGNAENAKVSLIDGVSNITGEPVCVAETVVKNGKFQFKGRVEDRNPINFAFFCRIPRSPMKTEIWNTIFTLKMQS